MVIPPPPLSLHLKLNQVSLIQLVSLGPGSPGRPGRPASPSGPRAPLQTVAASYAAIPQGILALWKPDRHSQGNCSPLEKKSTNLCREGSLLVTGPATF